VKDLVADGLPVLSQASLSCSEALLCDALLRARESARPSCAAMGASALLGASNTEDSEPLIESAGGVAQRARCASSSLLGPASTAQRLTARGGGTSFFIHTKVQSS